MGNVIEFKKQATGSEQAAKLRQTMDLEERGELEGLIQISATEDGESITILGAFADRMQYGAVALVKALNMMCDKLCDSEGAGYSYSPPIHEVLRRKKRPMPEALMQTTDFGTLR